MHMRFVPNLLLTKFFYAGLLTQIRRVFTLPLFIVGVAGIALATREVGRTLMAGLWIGWVAFAIAFTYHMPTHDYYHWPYIAAVSLGAAALWSRLEQLVEGRVPATVFTGLALAAGLVIAGWGTREAWPRLENPRAAAELARYHDIGVQTDHDTRVLFLDPEYGYPLMYHAEVAGDTWPNQDDLAAEALGGADALSAKDRYDRDYGGFNPHYFVITDLDSFEAQPDLQALLRERATLVSHDTHYRIYKFNTP
jgi:hypothetical protein